jgi:hypothetical protein
LEEAANWQEIYINRDPLLLLRRIRATHASGEVRITPIAINAAHSKYFHLLQNQNELISQYLKRFKNAIESIIAVDHENVPDDQSQATHFVVTLDSRWAQFRADLENSSRLDDNFEFPKTLVEMYEKASNYQVVSSQGTAISATAFVAQGNNNKGKRNNKNYQNSNILEFLKINLNFRIPGETQLHQKRF